MEIRGKGENSNRKEFNHGIEFSSSRDDEGIQIVLENGDTINMSYNEASLIGAYLSGASSEFYRQLYASYK